MLSFVRSLSCLLIAASVVASSPVPAIGVAVTQAKLKSVHLEYGIPYLTFDQPAGNPDGCASNAVVALAPDLPNQQFYLSLAMTALASGKPVSVWIDGCTSSPWFPTVPRVYAMQMVP